MPNLNLSLVHIIRKHIHIVIGWIVIFSFQEVIKVVPIKILNPLVHTKILMTGSMRLCNINISENGYLSYCRVAFTIPVVLLWYKLGQTLRYFLIN